MKLSPHAVRSFLCGGERRAIARKFFGDDAMVERAGERVGSLPPEAGVPPLVEDFRHPAVRLKVELDRVNTREVTLDLYRSAPTGSSAVSSTGCGS